MAWGRAVVCIVVAAWMVFAPFVLVAGRPIGIEWRMYDSYGQGTCRVTYVLDGPDGVASIDRLEALGQPMWARASLATRRLPQEQLVSDFAKVCKGAGPGMLEQRATCATARGWEAQALPMRRTCPGRPR
jgi:hypothetical protein